VIDPLEIMAKYGTDALRYALVSQAVPGRDMQLSDDAFVGARNFANKIWNASRFVLTNLKDFEPGPASPWEARDLADAWILGRLWEALTEAEERMRVFDLAQAARILHGFFWGDFCDWFIEMAKLRLQNADAGGKASRRMAQETLMEVLDAVLRALHPVMPFITEKLWGALDAARRGPCKSVMTAPWPEAPRAGPSASVTAPMGLIREVVTAVRTIRSEMNVPPGKSVAVWARCGAGAEPSRKALEKFGHYVRHLAKVSELNISANGRKPPQSAAAVVADIELFVPLEGLIDFEKEKARLSKEMARLEAEKARLEERIKNPEFVAKAPPEKVSEVSERLKENSAQRERLRGHLSAIGEI
jgi:valyl-tRNA synthetase